MGLFSRFKKTQATDGLYWNNAADFYGAWRLSNEEYERILGMSASEMWRTQPYLRTVVTFLARNIAQLGLHTYQREGEDDRRRVRDGFAEVVRRPNPTTTTYELVYGLVADLALHDVAYWMRSDDPAQPLTRLPVTWVTPQGGDAAAPARYLVRINDRGEAVRIPADQIIAFHGWHPDSLVNGSTPVSALREILAEQVQAARYREAVWRRGGKVGAVLTRPVGAPAWSDNARTQFKEDWDSQFTGTGARVGGTPLLEDGMSLARVDFNAHEMQFIEGSRLALNTVASVYHVNPTMIGLLDNANYSNVREFRRMLYGDTLGPILAQIEDRLNTFVLPLFDTRDALYCEFNIEEKLQGSFEEQTAALQSAVGRPWMVANEARALRNMPAIPGGDDLVTPLNVLVGGQASPTDSAPPKGYEVGTKRGNLYLLKARASDAHQQKVTEVLRHFFRRQGDSVLPSLGREPWDDDRWNRELSDDLHATALAVTEVLGKQEAAALGFSPSEYDPAMTVNYLRQVAENYAVNINETTKTQLAEQQADPEGDPRAVYDLAVDTRAAGIAVGVTTFLAGWATVEAAQQLRSSHDVEVTKTWVAGPNPRSTHAALDGETVGIDDTFSNGMAWPGQGGDAGEVAGCNCTVQVNLA